MLAGPGRVKIIRSANNPAGNRDSTGYDRELDEAAPCVSPAGRAAAPARWTPERMRQWAGDDAVLALDPVGGRHVADVAGTQDVSFDRPPSPVDTTILGYPVSHLAGGEALLSCARPTTLEVNSVTSAWRTDCDPAFTDAVKDLHEQAGKL